VTVLVRIDVAAAFLLSVALIESSSHHWKRRWEFGALAVEIRHAFQLVDAMWSYYSAVSELNCRADKVTNAFRAVDVNGLDLVTLAGQANSFHCRRLAYNNRLNANNVTILMRLPMRQRTPGSPKAWSPMQTVQ